MGEREVAPTPPPFRPRSGSKRRRKTHVSLVTAVQERDVEILIDLYDKRVLTTHHIKDIYFPSADVARRRLLHLFRHALIDRFRPQPEIGSAPIHYVLGKGGAEVVAARLGKELKEVFERNQLKQLAYSPFIEHLLATNTFYSRLAWGCRQAPNHRLEWLGEISARRNWLGIVRPDGLGRIDTPARALTMFLEMDMGTEPLGRLTDKLATGYRMAAQTGARRPDLLLFCFPSPTREANARQALHPIGMTIATTWMQFHDSNPLGAIWLPLGAEQRRPLFDLPVESADNGNGHGELL
jgi:protein involved in plasmid replication-relaxation